MKKIVYIFILVLFTCCSKDVYQELSPSKTWIVASLEQETTTRLTMDENKYLLWHNGDAFTVFSQEGYGDYFELVDGAGTASATFLGNNLAGKPTYAAYPSAFYPTLEGSILSMTLPSTINCEADGNLMVPMYAVFSENTIHFKQLVGLLRVVLSDLPDDADGLEIESSNPICGNFKVDISQDLPCLTSSASENNNKVTVNLSVLAKKNDRVLFIPLPCGIYASLKATVIKTDGTRIPLTVWKEKTVERATLYNSVRSYEDNSDVMIIKLVHSENVLFPISFQDETVPVKVDWGDGTESEFSAEHHYTETGSKTTFFRAKGADGFSIDKLNSISSITIYSNDAE